MSKKTKDLDFMLGCGMTAKGLGSMFGLGVLTLQSTKNMMNVGSKVSDKDLLPGRATVYFGTVASVTALINELKDMRKEMRSQKKKVLKVNASNNSTNGRSNKRGKVSRERTKR